MKKALFLFLISISCCWGFPAALAQSADSETRAREFLKMREEMLQTIAKEHAAVETRDRDVRRLLITKSKSGQAYGKSGRIYYFTEEGHPAHPAMMMVQVVEKDGNLVLSRRGLSGGDNELFRKWVDDSRANDRADGADILGGDPGNPSSTLPTRKCLIHLESSFNPQTTSWPMRLSVWLV